MVYQAYITTSVLREKQPPNQWYRTVSISYHTHANRSAGSRSSSAHVVCHSSGTRAFPPTPPPWQWQQYSKVTRNMQCLWSLELILTHCYFFPYPTDQSKSHSQSHPSGVGNYIPPLWEELQSHIPKGMDTRKGDKLGTKTQPTICGMFIHSWSWGSIYVTQLSVLRIVKTLLRGWERWRLKSLH